MEDKPKRIFFKKHCDKRGNLVPVESNKDIPFQIERIFYIKDVDSFPRGFHAHEKSKQVLVAQKGSFVLELNDGEQTTKYKLDKDNEGIYIPTYTWLKMRKFSDDCIILVICSYHYDEAEYIRNYGDFLRKKTAYIESREKEIKCFDLKPHIESMRPSIDAEIKKVIDNCQFVLGPQLQAFENNFAKYIGAKHCVGVSNGTSAIVAALKAIASTEKNKEITVFLQSNTYIAAALAASQCGFPIEIVDIGETLNMDLNKLEDLLEKDKDKDCIKIVILVHLYGTCCDMERVLQLRDQYGFYIVEDAAQAHGSQFQNKLLGNWGDVGCFSFYPSKNLGSIGEGGAICTNNQDIANYVRKYRNYGSVDRYHWEIQGANERMHNIQASVLNIMIPRLDEWNAKRQIIAEVYDSCLVGNSHITIPKQSPGLVCNYHIYPILVCAKIRDRLRDYLAERGIQTAIHYPITFYKSPAFKELNNITTKADEVCKQIISLPIYPEMPLEKVHIVCKYVLEGLPQYWNKRPF